MRSSCNAYGVVFFLGLAATFTPAVSLKSAEAAPPAAGVYSNETGSPLLALIASAKKTLDIEIYEMENAKFMDAVRGALRRGVRVRLVKDPSPVGGDKCRLFPSAENPRRRLTPEEELVCKNQLKLKNDVIRAGGKFVPFAKSELCGTNSKCFQHGKMVIVDGTSAMISTGNFNDSNLCDKTGTTELIRCDRDFSVVLTDSVRVSALTKIFEKDLQGKKYDVAPIVRETGDRLTVSPISLDPLVALIDSAEETIEVQNQYLKDPTLNQALFRAADRGVDVNVTISSVCAFGPPSDKEFENYEKLFTTFDEAGLKTRMFTSGQLVNGVPGYLHSKVFIVDGKKAWVGSVNGSTNALTNNREFGILTTNAADLKLLSETLENDRNHPASETWKQSIHCMKDKPFPKDESGRDR